VTVVLRSFERDRSSKPIARTVKGVVVSAQVVEEVTE
jgi:hypothetical protein